MSRSKPLRSCYMCDQPSSTREHVPPRSFFPKGKRPNLWTVPSCPTHNLENNQDVEYVRNVIVTQLGTNATAENILEVAKRSWDHSPALFARTFHDFGRVTVQEQQTGAFTFDLVRVKSVMSSVAHALAYRDFGRPYLGDWQVFCATLRSRKPAPDWDDFRKLLGGGAYEPVVTPHPEVFEYGIHRTKPIGLIYRLVFYGGFIVFAWPIIPLTEGGAAKRFDRTRE
jgi:hypothetical protein